MIIEGKIIKIAGPVIIADGMRGAQMYEMVRVGEQKSSLGKLLSLKVTPLPFKYMKKQLVFNQVK